MKLWIARDLDGTLWFFEEYPIKKEMLFYPTTDTTGKFTYYRSMPTDLFPEVTFENSPQEVELKLTSEKTSESIVNEFMDILNFTYDKSEKCMVAKIHNADLSSLKNIIESRLE